MILRRRSRPGYLLVSLLTSIALLAPLVLLVGNVSLRLLSAVRLAQQHHNRLAVMDGLLRRLRDDARQAESAEMNGARLRLEAPEGSPGSSVEYEFAEDCVFRKRTDGVLHEYRYSRLRFAAWLESGVDANLLRLSFIEQPPPARDMPSRSFDATVLLPPATSAQGGGAAPNADHHGRVGGAEGEQ
jgi:hypothetical protein